MSTLHAPRKRGRPSNAELAARRLEAMTPSVPEAPKSFNPLGPFKTHLDRAVEALGPELEPLLQPTEPPIAVPPSWTKGQLLNVRNAGEHYVITLLGEEFDPRYPERALKFTNSALCQNFVSNWYARENHDPRAR